MPQWSRAHQLRFIDARSAQMGQVPEQAGNTWRAGSPTRRAVAENRASRPQGALGGLGRSFASGACPHALWHRQGERLRILPDGGSTTAGHAAHTDSTEASQKSCSGP